MPLQEAIKRRLTSATPRHLIVACAHDAEIIASLKEVQTQLNLKITLIGDHHRIDALAQASQFNLGLCSVVHVPDDEKACSLAVSMANHPDHLLMKGLVDTKVILKAVLADKSATVPGAFLSHCSVEWIPSRPEQLWIISDGGLNIQPDLNALKRITQNAIMLAQKLAFDPINVALLSAVEKVNVKIPSSQMAADVMRDLADQYPANVVIEGPYALDNAIDADAAHHKGVTYRGAGRANVLIVPNIEAGNVLIKSLNFVASAQTAGVVLGAKMPIIVTSRADRALDKLNSILLACVVAQHG